MELKFKPLSKGLGFHSLPEPPKPSELPKPTPPRGARLAGTPSYAKNLPKTLPKHIPTPTAQVTAKPLVSAEAPETKNFSYLLRRMGAYFTDTTLNLAFFTLGTSFVLSRGGQRLWDFASWELGLVIGLLFFVASWFFVAIQELLFRTSIGKRVFDLNLPGSRTAIFLRNFFFPLSLAPLGLGVIWALWDSKRRTWHDMVVELQPELRARKTS